MILLEAEALGMCFGVRDALHALEQVREPGRVTIHGELVHNGQVLAELDRRGFRRTAEDARSMPATEVVMVTAHGISDRERRRLQSAGKVLLDTTCPLVRRAHDAALTLQAEGRRVVVIGKPGHVEVRGFVEDLERAIVVAAVRDVRPWPEPRLGIVCQTTVREDTAAELERAIREANPAADIRRIDTICAATRQRQQALHDLLPRIDALVVVGGRDSNNTRQLAEAARRAGIPAARVESADELDPAWLDGHAVVGLTAGTSTPEATIGAVRLRLRQLARAASGTPA